jgi:hypothetical protein
MCKICLLSLNVVKFYKSVEEKGRGSEMKKWTKHIFTNSTVPHVSGFNLLHCNRPFISNNEYHFIITGHIMYSLSRTL